MSEHQKEELRPAHSTDSLFTESAVKFLATYRVWIVTAVWLAVRGYVIWGLSPNYYIEGYFQLAGDWLDGYIPYADFSVEYPPGALLLFALPRIFTETPIVYGYIFAVVMLLVDLGILQVFWRIPALVRGGDVETDMARRYESTLLCLTYILFTAVFGRLLVQNYDLVIGLVLVASIYFVLRKKPLLVDMLLAAGIWLNLTVLAWIPLLWWYGLVSRDETAGSRRSLKISDFVRTLLLRTAVLAGSLGLLFLPFLMLSGRALGHIVQFHLERGTQLESSAASILMMGAKIFGFELSTEFTNRAIHLGGELGSQGAAVSGFLSITVFVILTIYLMRMIPVQSNQQARGVWLIRGLLATTLALLVTSKVFLPQ